MDSLWPLITILGPILLLAAIIWAYLRNRNASAEDTRRAEEGARQVRKDIEEDRQYRESPTDKL